MLNLKRWEPGSRDLNAMREECALLRRLARLERLDEGYVADVLAFEMPGGAFCTAADTNMPRIIKREFLIWPSLFCTVILMKAVMNGQAVPGLEDGVRRALDHLASAVLTSGGEGERREAVRYLKENGADTFVLEHLSLCGSFSVPYWHLSKRMEEKIKDPPQTEDRWS